MKSTIPEHSMDNLVDKLLVLKRQEKAANRGWRRQVGVNKRIAKKTKEFYVCKCEIGRKYNYPAASREQTTSY